MSNTIADKAMGGEPHVDVVVPAFNCATYLPAAIESLRVQEYDNWRAWIVDDCSSDNTWDIAQKCAAGDSRFTLHRLDANGGPAESRNFIIARASGPLLAFLDADDVWDSKKLVRQVEFLRQSGAGLTYTSYEKIDEGGRIISQIVHAPPTTNYRTLLLSNVIACSSVLLDIQACGRELMPLIRKRQDHAYWLKLTRRGVVAKGLDEPLLRYRVHPGSISSNKLDAARYSWLLYRSVEGLGIVRATYYFLNYAVRGAMKFLR